MRLRYNLWGLAAMIISCAAPASDQPDDAIYQLAPAAALAGGLFEGPTPFGALLRKGDFGLGALSPLDGEVIILDGTVYHARLDGSVRPLPEMAQTPFAVIKQFRTDQTTTLTDVRSLDDFTGRLDRHLRSANLLYALRVEGDFSYMKLRSVPRQKPPYPPIDQVVATQQITETENVRGTVVAFRFPGYLERITGSGYHLHFVDETRRHGGHVLDLRGASLTVAIDESQALRLMLPDDAGFRDAALNDATGSTEAFRRALRPE